MGESTHWVYIIICENGHYYTGYTTNVVRRYAEHLQGTAKCKYTRSFKPMNLEKAWGVSCKAEALRIERAIKKLSKLEKQKLILSVDNIEEFI